MYSVSETNTRGRLNFIRWCSRSLVTFTIWPHFQIFMNNILKTVKKQTNKNPVNQFSTKWSIVYRQKTTVQWFLFQRLTTVIVVVSIRFLWLRDPKMKKEYFIKLTHKLLCCFSYSVFSRTETKDCQMPILIPASHPPIRISAPDLPHHLLLLLVD